MSEVRTTSARNPWKTGVIAGGVAFAVLLGAGLVSGLISGLIADPGGSEVQQVQEVQETQPADPPHAVIEDCNRYAAATTRDDGRILRDGVIGGALGAGVGAAGGAIADGGDGAGKGAGLGALLGAAAGTLHGLNEENRKTEAARNAYGECMARRGY